jgi:hypothetical protein
MYLFPRSLFGRILCALWLAVCAYCLIWTFLKRDTNVNGEVDLGFTLAMLLFTFPIGYVLASAASFIIRILYDSWGIVIPGGFLSNTISWIILVPAGYFQWFVLIPWICRKLKKS